MARGNKLPAWEVSYKRFAGGASVAVIAASQESGKPVPSMAIPSSSIYCSISRVAGTGLNISYSYIEIPGMRKYKDIGRLVLGCTEAVR